MATPPQIGLLDIGSPGDSRYISGAYPAEQNPIESYRWTAGPSEVWLPVPVPGTYDITLRMDGVLDEQRELTLSCADVRERVEIPARSGTFEQTLSCEADSSAVTVLIDADLVPVPGGDRLLGVSMLDASVTPGDASTVWIYRVLEAVAVASVLAGIWLAGRVLLGRTGELLAFGVAFAWLTGAVARSDLFISFVPTVEVAVVFGTGMAIWLLRRGEHWHAASIGLLLAGLLLWIQPAPLALRATGLWRDVDVAALDLLPWIAVASIVLGATLGGARAHGLPALGSGIALVAVFAPVFLAYAGDVASVSIEVPAWTVTGTALSTLLVLSVGALALWGAWVAIRSERNMVLSVGLIVGVALAFLLGWRVQTFDFDGDEPHYYVMARSIGQDGDLELLDDYVDPQHLEATISPIGNIAVRRDFSANRYTALAPTPDDAWFIVPPQVDGWEGSEQARLTRAEAQPAIERDDGSRARLPALKPSERLTLLFPDGCRIDQLWIASVNDEPVSVDLSARDRAGETIWTDSVMLDDSGGVDTITPSLTCAESGPIAVRLGARPGEIVALGYDLAARSPFVAPSVAGGAIYAGLPRDRYASIDVGVRVLLHNASSETQPAELTFIGESGSAVLIDDVRIAPGETAELEFAVTGAEAVRVAASDGVWSAAIGRVAGAEYRILPVAAGPWDIPINLSGDADGGVWLTMVNGASEPRSVTITTGSGERVLDLCGGCARTVLLTADDGPEARIMADDKILLGALEYEERTASLHFDPGLPLLTALPARFGPPWSVLLIPVLAATLLASGMATSLRNMGLDRVWVVIGGVAVLLAPMSPFAVRLYTEIVAAALIVWALIFWGRGREVRNWNLGVLAIAAFLPILHGRLIPIALALMVLSLVNVLGLIPRRGLNRRQVVMIGGGLGALVLTGLMVAEFAVSPFSRDVADYFQFRWVPVNLVGMLFDRGSGLLPVAPWIVLAIAAPRPLTPLQRAALLLTLANVTVVTLRAGSWMTWGPPGRYLLPVAPLVLLFAAPAAVVLWQSRIGRFVVAVAAIWSAIATVLLHWVPLAGYISWPRYLIDETFDSLIGSSPARLFPTVQPAFGGLGYQMVGACVVGGLALVGAWLLWKLAQAGIRPSQVEHGAKSEGDA